jgi:hypothetical protein
MPSAANAAMRANALSRNARRSPPDHVAIASNPIRIGFAATWPRWVSRTSEDGVVVIKAQKFRNPKKIARRRYADWTS